MIPIDLFQTRFGIWIAALFYLLICLELGIIFLKKKRYDWKDTAANLAILIGVRVSEMLFLSIELKGLVYFYSKTPFKIPNTPLTVVGLFILTDFIYYWKHRLMHTRKVLWAFHVVHHSSPHLNLTTSFRLNWLQALINFPFFIPPVLIGFDPYLLLLLYSISAVYQFFVHTEHIQTLGVLEWMLNTPSHHRVHHAKNNEYLNKNFGGVLIIWDRLFKTFAQEIKPPNYGITSHFQSYNPFRLVFHSLIDLVKGRLNYRG